MCEDSGGCRRERMLQSLGDGHAAPRAALGCSSDSKSGLCGHTGNGSSNEGEGKVGNAVGGDNIGAVRCNGGCDNCASTEIMRVEDVSEAAAAAVRVVARMNSALSFGSLEKLLRGSRERRLLADGHDSLPEFGSCACLRTELPRMLRLLIAKRILREDCLPTSHGGFSSRLYLGINACVVWGISVDATGSDREFRVADPPKSGSVLLALRGRPKGTAAWRRGAASRQARARVQSDDEDEDDDSDDSDDDDDDDGEEEETADAGLPFSQGGACLPCDCEDERSSLPDCERDRDEFFGSQQSAFERCAAHGGGRGHCFHRSSNHRNDDACSRQVALTPQRRGSLLIHQVPNSASERRLSGGHTPLSVTPDGTISASGSAPRGSASRLRCRRRESSSAFSFELDGLSTTRTPDGADGTTPSSAKRARAAANTTMPPPPPLPPRSSVADGTASDAAAADTGPLSAALVEGAAASREVHDLSTLRGVALPESPLAGLLAMQLPVMQPSSSPFAVPQPRRNSLIGGTPRRATMQDDRSASERSAPRRISSVPPRTPLVSSIALTPASVTSSAASVGSGRQDPATVSRIYELGLSGASVIEIDRTLFREGHKTSTGTRWPAKNDGRVVVRLLLNNGIVPTAGDAKVARYIQEYTAKLGARSDKTPTRRGD